MKVQKFINYELKNKLFNDRYLKKFKNKILEHIKSLFNFISFQKKNMKISVYGASGKGQALMQFCNIDFKLIDKVYDKSNLKKGKFTLEQI